MKNLNRNQLITKLENKYPGMFLRTSEDFNGSTGGIWTTAEGFCGSDGLPLFEYYEAGPLYTMNVVNPLAEYLSHVGWWAEFQDPGTVIIWAD